MQTKKEIIAITITLIIIYKGHLYHNWVKEIVGITLSFYIIIRTYQLYYTTNQ